MSQDIIAMFQALCRREPTTEDLQLLRGLIRNLPAEVYESPVMMAEIVLRIDFLHQMNAAVQKATWSAEQKINASIEPRVEKAAVAAFNRIRDLLPMDARDALKRLLKWATAWTLLVLVVAAVCGWFAREYFSSREQARHQAVYEREFNRCVEAAEGIAVSSNGTHNGLRYDGVAYRSAARGCASEYADRRAGL